MVLNKLKLSQFFVTQVAFLKAFLMTMKNPLDSCTILLISILNKLIVGEITLTVDIV